MEESLRRIEPTIASFEKEALIYINLSQNLSHYEKSDFVRRGHHAKENMLFFAQQLEIKETFLKDLSNETFISPKL